MDTLKNNQLINRNIRIRTNTKSRSKSRNSFSQKEPTKILAVNHKFINEDKKSNSKVLKLIMNNPKNQQKNILPSNLLNDNQKRMISTQERQSVSKIKENSFHLKTPIINSLKIKNSSQEGLKNTLCMSVCGSSTEQINTEKKLKIVSPTKSLSRTNGEEEKAEETFDRNSAINNSKFAFSQNEQYFFTECRNINIIKSNWFQISNAFSISIKHDSTKTSTFIQTSESTLDDKYYLAYMRYRLLKQKSFEDLKFRQEKLGSLIKQTEDFKKNYENLLDYIKDGPQNDRQNRVYALSIDLDRHQKRIQTIFSGIIKSGKQFENEYLKKIASSEKKSAMLIQSIQNLTNACMTLLKPKKSEVKTHFQNNAPSCQLQGKLSRILGRISAQFYSFTDVFVYFKKIGTIVIDKYHNETLSLKNEYDIWSNLQYQNKVLLYNFMRQIKKIPALSTALFGYQNQDPSQDFQSKTKTQEQKKFDQYMSTKCEGCYEMKNKIKLIQKNNTQLKPIFKVIEWLIRDVNKEKKLLELI